MNKETAKKLAAPDKAKAKLEAKYKAMAIEQAERWLIQVALLWDDEPREHEDDLHTAIDQLYKARRRRA